MATVSLSKAGCSYTQTIQSTISQTTTGNFLSSYFPAAYEKAESISIPTISELQANENLPSEIVLSLPSYQNSEFKGIFNAYGEQVSTSTILTNPTEGFYTAKYDFWRSDLSQNYFLYLTYRFSVAVNLLPRKKQTITDVIIRLCETIEPLVYGQQPRFKLSGVNYFAGIGVDNESGRPTGLIHNSLAEDLDKILSPEFSFTKQTFREQLQQIGGVIHAEPRIVEKQKNSKAKGGYTYVIDYDFYGKQQESDIKNRRRVTKIVTTSVNEYHTALDSSVENLTNSSDDNITTYEPNATYSISLRTDNTFARLTEDDSTYIPTQYPILRTVKVYITGYPTAIAADGTPTMATGEWEITQYVVEKTKYDNLSSYDEVYPYSKSFALYYEQGEKNIKGLWFSVPSATSSYALKNYAILNILQAVTGNSSLSIPTNGYPFITFRVEYQAFHNERIITAKGLITGGKPRTLVYNQSANGIETKSFGEHLKGLSAKIGNVEKTETYILSYLSDIPKAGMKYDDDYYISTVEYEIKPTYILCTIGLSKHYNRQSEYIGLNSVNRMWEVSERQIIERQIVFNTYLCFSVTEANDSTVKNDTANSANGVSGTWRGFSRFWGNTAAAFQNLEAQFLGKNSAREAVSKVLAIPVITSAGGNTLSVSFSMKDNYGAGQQTKYNVSPDTGVSGMWGNDVAYGDMYGEIEYADISVTSAQNVSATLRPQTTLSNVSAFALFYIKDALIRKDSREALSCSFNVHAVTVDKRIIIGSALFQNSNIFAHALGTRFEMFTHKLNPLGGKVEEGDTMSGVTIYSNTTSSNYIQLPTGISTDYVSWAWVTNRSTKTIDVTTADGRTTTQTIQTGGEILLGGNFHPAGQKIWFQLVNDVEDMLPEPEEGEWQ